MNIEETWHEINDSSDRDLAAMLRPSGLTGFSSHNPLEKIKKNMVINMVWGLLICVLYIAVIIHFPIWQVQAAMGIVFIFSLWAIYTAFLEYKRLNTAVSSTRTLLDEMKRHHQSITRWMHTQQKVALFIYPISATGGFMLGGVSGSGKTVEDFMSKPLVWGALLIALIILVPACYFLAKWLFKLSFGKHLKTLTENIKTLELEK